MADIDRDVDALWPFAVIALCVFIIVLALAGCAGKAGELAVCREYLPKCADAIQRCDSVVQEQRAALEQGALQIGLCNDLNAELKRANDQLRGSIRAKQPARKYKGDPYQKEKA